LRNCSEWRTSDARRRGGEHPIQNLIQPKRIGVGKVPQELEHGSHAKALEGVFHQLSSFVTSGGPKGLPYNMNDLGGQTQIVGLSSKLRVRGLDAR
jgi:hypothetical protein